MNDTTLVHVTDTNAPPPPAPLSPAEINRFLDYACEQLKIRRAELIKALGKSLIAHPTIEDDDALGLIAENMRMAAALNRTAEERRTEHKAPFLNGGRAVDAWFKSWAAPLALAMEPVQAAMNDYGARKLAREEAAAEAARVQAQIEADRAAHSASEALRRGSLDEANAALDRVSDAAALAEQAENRANARPADLTRSYGSHGAVASVRRDWDFEVTDLAKVPLEYMMVNKPAVEVAKRQRDRSGKPTRVIPGILWVAKSRMGVR